jgi:hypothetical protein
MKQHGVELVLHGHNHEQTILEFETASGVATVIGVPSASEAVEGREPAARYNEYAIARSDGGWRCEMVGRAATATEHVWECERRVLRSGKPHRREQAGGPGEKSDRKRSDDHT